MTTSLDRNRAELRRSVGRNLIAHRLAVSAASAYGDTTSLVDDALLGGDDNYNGWWIVLTGGGANGGGVRRVADYDAASNRLSWRRPLPSPTAEGAAYELWPPEYAPPIINDYLSQAIAEGAGRFYAPVEAPPLHAGDGVSSFPLSDGVDAISRVEVRRSIASATAIRFDTPFDGRTPAGWRQSVDAAGGRGGRGSLRITLPANVQEGDFLARSLPQLDLSRSTRIEGWIRCDSALARGDVALRLNSGAVQAPGSDAENIPLPAAEAGRWTFYHVPLANPWRDAAITSLGVSVTAALGGRSLWLDGLRAVDADTAAWRALPRRLWSVKRAARRLELTAEGRRAAGDAVIRLAAWRKPAPLNADDSTTEAPGDYLVARATSLALRASPEPSDTSREAADRWDARAFAAYDAFPLIVDARRVG